MNYGEWLDFWLQTFTRSRVKNSTFHSYLQDAAYLVPLHALTLSELDYLTLQGFINSLACYSASVVRRVMGLLRRSLDCAVRCGKLPAHCANVLELPRCKAARKVEALSEFEIAQLFELPAHQRGHYFDFFMFMLFSGLRVGEAIALEHGDIRGDVLHVCRREYRGEVIEEPKTAAGVRDIPLTPELRELIKHSGTQCGLIFRNSRGDMIKYRHAYDSWQRLQSRANFRNRYGLHTFRHTFASMAYRGGADIKTLSELLGHSHVSVTYDTYCHITCEQAADAMRCMRVALRR